MSNLSPIFFIVGIFFLVVILPGTLFYFKKHKSYLGKNQLKRLKEDEDFDVAQMIYGLNNSFLVAIDYDLAKVAYIEDDHHLLLNFSDILGAKVLNKNEIHNLSAHSGVRQPALVGKNLLVDPSTIITPENEADGKITPSILLHLSLSLKHLPDIYINCFDFKYHTVSPTRAKHISYSAGMELAHNLESIFTYISNIHRPLQDN